MVDDDAPDGLVLSEAQFRRVIELAVRVTPRSEGVSLAQLREIAHDLEIDQESLARALSIVLAQSPDASPARSWLGTQATRVGRLLNRVLPNRARLVAGGLIGGLIGWYVAYIGLGMREVVNGMSIMRGSTSFLSILATIVLSLLTLANSLSRRRDGRRARYLAETVTTWGSMAVAWSIMHGYASDDLVRLVGICVGVFGLWGWLIIRPLRGPDDGAVASAESNVARRSAVKPPSDDQRTLLEWIRLARVTLTAVVLTRAQAL